MLTLDKLKIGQSAAVEGFSNSEISLKLQEMGCVVGEEIMMERVAPFGDPISVTVAGYSFSLRKKEASFVSIKLL